MSAKDESVGEKLICFQVQASHQGVDFAAALLEEKLTGLFNSCELFGVVLGFREAMTNAVVHGSKLNPQKSVRCEACLNCDTLSITVEDQGAGFAIRESIPAFPDPTVEGHRGLGIIRCYFDEFNYNEKGNKLLLTKRRL